VMRLKLVYEPENEIEMLRIIDVVTHS